MMLKKAKYYFVNNKNNFSSLPKYDPYKKYFIKITDIYEDYGKVMVKYFMSTHGIFGDMTVSEFINSSLIFSVHPLQIYLLGIEVGKSLTNKISNNNAPVSFQSISRTMNQRQYLH